MPKTATRGEATQQTPKAKKPLNSKTIEVDLGDKGKALLDKMAEHRQVRLAAEKEEKVLKEQLVPMIEEALGRKQKRTEKLIVRAAGVIRGTRAWRSRKQTDVDLLLEAFPEAFEAAVSDNEYPQFDPA
jgi:hypothetical protein